MHFSLEQRLPAPVAAVAATFCDPDYYAALATAPKLGAPEVLGRTQEGDRVRMRVRYHFAGDLAPAARAVLDPEKLSWVEEAEHDLAAFRTRFVLKPDHYADRFSCRGTYQLRADPGDDGATIRSAEGELKVRAPLVGSTVERAIVSGLEEHAEAEVAIFTAFLAR